MSMKKILAAGALTVGLLGGGAVIANATTSTTTSTAVTASSADAKTGASVSNGTVNASVAPNQANPSNQPGQPGQPMGDPGANPADTTITGTNADKATAAVVAANPGFKVSLVQQDPDGSYDVHGTLNGSGRMFNVTTDFKISSDPGLGMVHSQVGSATSKSAGASDSTSAANSSAATNSAAK